MKRFVWLLICIAAASPAYADRSDVLVIVNDNSIDSPQVGEYYAQQRNIPSQNLVHVRAPNQFFINWNEFQSLRDQVLRLGLCPRLAPQARPAACDDWNQPIYTASAVGQITANSPIKYVVLTRGVPTRMRVGEGAQVSESTSVDNYLRFWLARYIPADISFGAFTERSDRLRLTDAHGWRRRLSTVAPALDHEYVIGRIDGLDLDSAKALVDRTLAAERDGFYGKLYTDQLQITPWRHAFGLFDELRPECSDVNAPAHYLAYPETTTQGKTPAHCVVKLVKSVGSTITEHMPGVDTSRQPLVDEAVAYFGHLDGQTIQGGFNTLLNWRKDRTCSSTLCADAADPQTCKAASTDPFKEIDTRCVGVASGFLGFNYQSYPVANFGSWPTGWEPLDTSENDAPRIDAARGADGSHSAWFDKADEPPDAQCYPYANGRLGSSLGACRAISYPRLQQTLSILGVDPAAPDSYRLVLHTFGENLASPTTLTAQLTFRFQIPSSGVCPSGARAFPSSLPKECLYDGGQNVTIANESAWRRFEFVVTPPAIIGSPRINSLTLRVFGAPRAGRIGLDAISVTKLTTHAQLVKNGSFSEGHRQASTGDFAANFISRLGGAAFWGSVSHHFTGGSSFSGNSLRTLAFMLRGLPLGDAVWLGEHRNSGVFYGDPLYSPTRMRMMPLPDPDSRINTGVSMLRAYVEQGTASRTKRVRFDVCRSDEARSIAAGGATDPQECSASGGWRNLPGSARTTTSATISPVSIEATPDLFPEAGDYILRMQTASVNPATGVEQVFNDYYPIKHRYADAELSIHSIHGRVFGPSGQPLSTVPLNARGARNDARSSYTSLSGEFHLGGLRDGSYTISTEHPGCRLTPVSGTHPIVITEADVLQDFRCESTGSRLHGRVTKSADRGLTDVLIYLRIGNGPETLAASTNDAGYFDILGLASGAYTVSFRRADWSFPTLSATVSGEPVELNAMGTTGPQIVDGYVRNEMGSPLAGASIYGQGADGDSFEALTDRNGYFSRGGAIDQTYELWPYAENHATPTDPMLARPNTAPIDMVLTKLPTFYAVSGFVTVGQQPASGFVATLIAADGAQQQTVTSSSGFYRFESLAPGAYRVRVHGYGSTFFPEQAVTISDHTLIYIDFVGS